MYITVIAGEFYRRADNQIVGPVVPVPGDGWRNGYYFPFSIDSTRYTNYGRTSQAHEFRPADLVEHIPLNDHRHPNHTAKRSAIAVATERRNRRSVATKSVKMDCYQYLGCGCQHVASAYNKYWTRRFHEIVVQKFNPIPRLESSYCVTINVGAMFEQQH